MPTHLWKHVPVFWPSLRCILFCMTRSSALSAICRKRFTRRLVMDDLTVANFSSRTARSYVSATALMDGRIIGWSTGLSIQSPSRRTLRSRPRRLSMYSAPSRMGIIPLNFIHIKTVLRAGSSAKTVGDGGFPSGRIVRTEMIKNDPPTEQSRSTRQVKYADAQVPSDLRK